MASRKDRRGIPLCCAALIFALITAPGIAAAQGAPPAPLPPTAQEALDKGIIAAKVPDYPLAVRFFEEARKLAPRAPVIYLNLGLAESRIPSRELRAIAWFGAYLAAYPDAPNVAAVKEQIALLDVRNQSNVSRLLKTVQDAAMQLPIERVIDKDKDGRISMETVNRSAIIRDYGLKEVSKLWAQMGDIPLALKAAGSILDVDQKSMAQRDIAGEQARANDFAGAQRTTDRIQDAHYKTFAQADIGREQAKAGDIAGAQKTVAGILDPRKKDFALSDIASAQARGGDIKGAQRTADSIPDDGKYQSGAYAAIAKAQAEAGDIAGAQKTADSIQSAYHKAYAQSDIAEAQAEAGDIAGAQKTADSIQDASVKDIAQRGIAYAQTLAGDIAGARKTAGKIQNAKEKEGWVEYFIAMAQARAGDMAGAQKTVDGIKSADRKRLAQAGVTEVQVKIDPGSAPALAPPVGMVNQWILKNEDALSAPIFLNLGDHLKTLPTGDSRKTFVPLLDAAKAMVSASTDIATMLKQQTKR